MAGKEPAIIKNAYKIGIIALRILTIPFLCRQLFAAGKNRQQER